MATPFLVLKTLTGFSFQFTKVLSHFRELVLFGNRGKFAIMAVRQSRCSKEKFAQHGDLIYQTQICPPFRSDHHGKIWAIAKVKNY